MKPLKLVYSNLWGPSPVLSIKGYQYYIIFFYAYSQYTWLYPLKLKSDALSIFKVFHKLVKVQFQTKLKALQTNNGGDYKVFLPYLHSCGI